MIKLFSKFDRLLAKAVKLGSQTVIMPIDEIRLATEFSSLANQERVVKRLMSEAFNHANMHVRRIAINACRRSESFDIDGLSSALTDKLSDPSAWVRYDAAWTILEAGFDSPEIRFKLSQIAGTPSVDDERLLKLDPGNAELQAKVSAQQALNKLEGRHKAK